MMKYYVDLESLLFFLINFSQNYSTIFNCNFNSILLHFLLEKQANNYFYFVVNNRGFYISVNHSRWTDLGLTTILLLANSLHLGLHCFNQYIIVIYYHKTISLFSLYITPKQSYLPFIPFHSVVLKHPNKIY